MSTAIKAQVGRSQFGARAGAFPVGGLRALALAAALAAPAAAQDGPFVAQDGVLVIEMESGSPTGQWASETQPGGFTGSNFIRWNGPNLFQSPGSDIFGFDFTLAEGGRYHFRLHNRHDHPDSTEANDVWVRMDGGQWVKTFSWQRGQWTWATQHEFGHDDKPPAEYQLAPGQHRIEFSGRSHDFMIDRLHLYKDGTPSPLNVNLPESPRLEVNDRPIAKIQTSLAAVPELDGFQTVVTLDGTGSEDPDGDALEYAWEARGVKLVGAGHRHSPSIQVTIKGDFAMPVRLRVSDGEHIDFEHAFINVEGSGGTVSGEGTVWHPVTVDFEGPALEETSNGPNPFLDRRLSVTFTAPDGTETVVPGFFDGDGQGGGSGNVWRARITPDQAGVWSYRASFRLGEGVAISLDPEAGAPVNFDGASGAFGVLPRTAEAPGLLAEGRLEYVGEHYLKRRDGGHFIKTGTNSPENFLAYAGFDNVQDLGGVGIIHRYGPHVGDWRAGDPLFVSADTGVDSKGIIGALNYLETQGVNSIYFLPLNLGGDGQDTTPHIGYADNDFHKTHFDISRLHQWTQVLDHAQRRGILVHFVLAETEVGNETWLDGGGFGVQRKLFFRELAARFAHLNGVKWNLSEENDFSVTDLRAMAAFMKAVDPYDHAVAVHTHPNDLSDYQAIVGDPNFDAASVQYTPEVANGLTQQVRNMSVNAGRRWVVDMDENGTWDVGLSGSNAGQMRVEVLYDVLFSNGGIEWYCGYHPLPLGGDVRLENFRTREEMWRYSRIAREFMEEHLDVVACNPVDAHVISGPMAFGGAEVMKQPGVAMAIFLPDVTNALQVDLVNMPGEYRVRWFDPRTGDEVGQGPNVTGPGVVDLQVVPANRSVDWIVLLERD